jgi:p-cymene monooxygenase electron transfer component
MRSFFKSIFGGGGAKPRQTVEIQPQGVTIDIASGQTILEAALSQGVAYPHNCTVGTCGSCKTRLLQGQVKAVSDFGYTLSKLELDAGYILACQAVPRDATTVVEIADPGADLPTPEACTGRIVSTSALTHDILLVEVATDQPVKYVAGQYASLLAPGMPRARHYSFADAPQREGRSSLTFFIRKVPGGEFTDALFSGALTGKPLNIEAPHGSFHLRPGNAPMVCIAGGSGLAPLISVLEDMRKNRVRRPCVLLFGARTQADLYALDQIDNIANAWPEPFQFVPVLSQEPVGSDWAGARGMVTDFIALPGGATDWRQAEGYLCGPPPMIDAGIERLVTLGVPLTGIHYDKFTDGAAVPASAVGQGLPA